MVAVAAMCVRRLLALKAYEQLRGCEVELLDFYHKGDRENIEKSYIVLCVLCVL